MAIPGTALSSFCKERYCIAWPGYPLQCTCPLVQSIIRQKREGLCRSGKMFDCCSILLPAGADSEDEFPCAAWLSLAGHQRGRFVILLSHVKCSTGNLLTGEWIKIAGSRCCGDKRKDEETDRATEQHGNS